MMNAKNGASIQLRELTKTYGRSQQKAVDNVSLDIRPGEFMTFLGPSGSGKTTTLNMIAGFADVTSGSTLTIGISSMSRRTSAIWAWSSSSTRCSPT